MLPIFDPIPLKRWFQCEKRDLPWRHNPTPYAVWVSEIMLQQTQVAVVIPYFERWMQKYPTLKDLARAPLDEVIKMWEGLGYYSRVRNLHQGAQYVLEAHGAVLPSSEEELKKIKGLGPYTVGAIRSFAFHQRTAAVDGNVIRVLARFFLIEEDIAKPKTVTKIRQIAEEILPEGESWIINEALIELGATICGRKPHCMKCPLRTNCKSFLQGVTDRIPYKSSKIRTEHLYRAVAILKHEDNLLVRRGKEGEIMSDLHEFPYMEVDKQGITHDEFQRKIEREWGVELIQDKELSEISHSFTRYQVKLFPFCYKVNQRNDVKDFQWISLSNLQKLAFSSGHRKILQEVIS